MRKIWERYVLKEFLQVFFLFLACFYGLYVVIDYASHAGSFHQHQTRFTWDMLVVYYASEFVHRSDVLVPFALLISTVRSLTKLNQSNELTALRAAGIPLKTLMRPLIYAGLFFTFILYVSEQWITPKAMAALKQIQDKHSSRKRKAENSLAAEHLVLQDGSTLIYQHYDTDKGLFFDSFWIRTPDKMYRIKSLNPHTVPPVGHYVNKLIRNNKRVLTVVSSEDEREFPAMLFNKHTLIETITPPEDLSLTQLWEKWPKDGIISSEKDAQRVTALYRKLVAPWLCLIAVIAPIPLCVRFNRQVPLFLLYSINIFGLVALYLILDSTQVLGKRQVMDPALAIGLPFILFLSFFYGRYARLNP